MADGRETERGNATHVSGILSGCQLPSSRVKEDIHQRIFTKTGPGTSLDALNCSLEQLLSQKHVRKV